MQINFSINVTPEQARAIFIGLLDNGVPTKTEGKATKPTPFPTEKIAKEAIKPAEEPKKSKYTDEILARPLKRWLEKKVSLS